MPAKIRPLITPTTKPSTKGGFCYTNKDEMLGIGSGFFVGLLTDCGTTVAMVGEPVAVERVHAALVKRYVRAYGYSKKAADLEARADVARIHKMTSGKAPGTTFKAVR